MIAEITNSTDFLTNLLILTLAGFLGIAVITRVSRLLHTPLMSLTNALDAVVVIAAIILVGRKENGLAVALGTIAVAASFSNVIGGFIITERMLHMFKKDGKKS